MDQGFEKYRMRIQIRSNTDSDPKSILHNEVIKLFLSYLLKSIETVKIFFSVSKVWYNLYWWIFRKKNYVSVILPDFFGSTFGSSWRSNTDSVSFFINGDGSGKSQPGTKTWCEIALKLNQYLLHQEKDVLFEQ